MCVYVVKTATCEGKWRKRRGGGSKSGEETSPGRLPLIWAPSLSKAENQTRQERFKGEKESKAEGEREGEKRKRKMIFLINSRACQKAEEMRASECWKRRA